MRPTLQENIAFVLDPVIDNTADQRATASNQIRQIEFGVALDGISKEDRQEDVRVLSALGEKYGASTATFILSAGPQ